VKYTYAQSHGNKIIVKSSENEMGRYRWYCIWFNTF